MKLSRLAALIFLAALAISFMATAVASAAAPEFKPATKQAFTGESGTGSLETSSTTAITCTRDTITGEVTGAKTIGSVIVTFHGCQSTEKSGCSLHSTGLPTLPVSEGGLIVTHILKGELGTTAESATGVGLLLVPANGGREFVTLEGTCLLLSPAPIEGTVVGEATPTEDVSKDGKLSFIGSKGTQHIKKFNLLGLAEEPKLTALGLLPASTTETVLALYTSAVEVT